jgi:hypothetical protein
MDPPRHLAHLDHIKTLYPYANSWAAIGNWLGSVEDMERMRSVASWFRRKIVGRVRRGELLG